MAERFFTKVANDVLEATEQVANRMEEGLTLLFNSGKLQEKNAAAAAAAHDDSSDYVPFGDEYDEQAHLEEELRNNPLQGIADSVVGGIMTGQASHHDCMLMVISVAIFRWLCHGQSTLKIISHVSLLSMILRWLRKRLWNIFRLFDLQ